MKNLRQNIKSVELIIRIFAIPEHNLGTIITAILE